MGKMENRINSKRAMLRGRKREANVNVPNKGIGISALDDGASCLGQHLGEFGDKLEVGLLGPDNEVVVQKVPLLQKFSLR